MIARPEIPTSWLDAELCARLCRRSWDVRILWDTVFIKRHPSVWTEGYDEVIITGQAQPKRRG